jgi:uncharacterized protein
MGLTLRAGLRRSCPIPSGTVGTFSRVQEKEQGAQAMSTLFRERENDVPTERPRWIASPAGGRQNGRTAVLCSECCPQGERQGGCEYTCRQADEGGPPQQETRFDGKTASPSSPAADFPREQGKRGTVDALRRLLRARERPRQAASSRRVLSPPAGDEIAPGLHQVETRLAYPASAMIGVPVLDGLPVDRTRLLCFDTETTGLAGGVGTRAFMIGVAAWADGVLTVRQLYLTAIAGERAMLQLFADWLQEDTILVSYNGKSYDAPLLKGRLRLNRVAHRLAGLPHIDWLHPTRRIYKGHLPNCKLATIEREVLRIVREDDLPGSEAPAAWLAYLRGQSSINLARVIEHNRQDVITLMRLGDHITSL